LGYTDHINVFIKIIGSFSVDGRRNIPGCINGSTVGFYNNASLMKI
jgi:hypothetical protein